MATTDSASIKSAAAAADSGGRLLAAADFAALDPRFGRLYALLASRAKGDRLPGRQHFDPLDVPDLLGDINLVDVVRASGILRFRYRLHGSRQTELARRDITGRFVEDGVLPRFVDRINGNMRRVVETRRPVYDRFAMPHPGRSFIDSERVYFPLARDGATVDMLLILNHLPDLE